MRGLKPRLVVSNEAVTAVPAPPSWLSKDAKAEWKRVAPDLVARGLLTDTDLGALENYCVAMGHVRAMTRAINRAGHMIAGKQHPLLRHLHGYLETSRRYAAEMGLTAVARHRAGASTKPPADESEDW